MNIPSNIPVAVGADGTIYGRETLTDEQNVALDAAIASYDPLPAAKAARIIEAAAACDAVLKPLASRFSEYETKTWAKQLSEAQALLADPSLPATSYPTIAGIIAVTGEDAATFAAAVVKNDEDWTAITAHAIGQRQRIVAQIKECSTPEEVAAVDVTIRLPG